MKPRRAEKVKKQLTPTVRRGQPILFHFSPPRVNNAHRLRLPVAAEHLVLQWLAPTHSSRPDSADAIVSRGRPPGPAPPAGGRQTQLLAR